MYVIGFNGPPHCGKDTIAYALADWLRIHEAENDVPIWVEALSLPMRHVGFTILGEHYTPQRYAEVKDEYKSIFDSELGKPATLRQFMINFSELFIKPTYGCDFWAKQLARRVDLDAIGFLIVTDIGFQEECSWLDTKGVGSSRFTTIQLERDGTDWSKDSRGYCSGLNRLRIANNTTVEEAVQAVVSHMIRLGWPL